ncbi:MAG: glycine--tRNA ligase subunit beta, partial [Eggerthellaceae bacterium]|nr:glycine--tRNA ligase subunit beta [Eggerthellaceae bacterium]
AARLYDAKFFYETDLKVPLSKHVDMLGQLVFQEELGSMLDKTKRVVKLSSKIAVELQLSGKDLIHTSRAAFLCKGDLITRTVVEFTSLQGVMGKYFAQACGEDDEVCLAIEEHYMPKAAGGRLPSTLPGQIVSFADKIDSICGLFAIGKIPTGSTDPFALRRSALGVIAMQEDKVPVKIENLIDYSLDLIVSQGVNFDRVDVKQHVIDFFIVRGKTALVSAGFAYDAVEAVLSSNVVEHNVLAARVKALTEARKNLPDTFDNLTTAHIRANNLRDPELGTEVDLKLLSVEEAILYHAISELDNKLDFALVNNDFETAIKELASIRGAVDDFFDKVIIVDKADPAGTENRMRLLNYLVEVFLHFADFSKMSKITE